MEERKWEDLEFDCLVNVLGRVDMESLLLYVPFVCKSWYEASLNPSCWKHLVFPQDMHSSWDVEDLTLIQKFNLWCPALISLSLSADHFLSSEYSCILPTLIGKWEHLESLWLANSDNLVDIITQISLACSNFSGLNVSSATIGEKEASAIVTNLPNIKSLILRGAEIDLENVVIILQGCRNLVHLDVRNCTGFISDDERVLELASNIKTFMCEGSRLDDYDYDYEDFGDDFDERFDGYRST
ncbi:hypothetical protein OIU85_000170 [Salix viminalis]|uniref:F-box domain-containing protein n=1 Tax=Salix viminalis TaxID=40686 RepID=A0A9Q0VKZ5_SALVM|nr:hypothetical protein OIU85_000170 [Salix viminalis]